MPNTTATLPADVEDWLLTTAVPGPSSQHCQLSHTLVVDNPRHLGYYLPSPSCSHATCLNMLVPLVAGEESINSHMLTIQDPRPQAGPLWPPWYAMGVSAVHAMTSPNVVVWGSELLAYLPSHRGSVPRVYLLARVTCEGVGHYSQQPSRHEAIPDNDHQTGGSQSLGSQPFGSTHVYQARLSPVYDALMASLRVRATMAQQSEDGVQRSNKGGWQSNVDMLTRLPADERELVLEVLGQAIYSYFKNGPLARLEPQQGHLKVRQTVVKSMQQFSN